MGGQRLESGKGQTFDLIIFKPSLVVNQPMLYHLRYKENIMETMFQIQPKRQEIVTNRHNEASKGCKTAARYTQIATLIIAGAITALFSSPMLMAADSIVLTNPTNGHKYQRIDSQTLTWTAARDYCKNIISPTGGYLATITSQNENDFIKTNLIATGNTYIDYWLGGSDADQQGVWKWVTTTEAFSYTDWNTGEPIIANGQYIAFIRITNTMKWVVENGSTANKLICEWGGTAYKYYVASATLHDMNANTFPEIATLFTDASTGRVTVTIRDAKTKALVANRLFGVPGQSFPLSITVLPDMNANGFQEIAVLLINKVSLKATQEIRDASTNALISSVPF